MEEQDGKRRKNERGIVGIPLLKEEKKSKVLAGIANSVSSTAAG